MVLHLQDHERPAVLLRLPDGAMHCPGVTAGRLMLHHLLLVLQFAERAYKFPTMMTRDMRAVVFGAPVLHTLCACIVH